MKKIFLLANIFALICTLTIRAQVTIGLNQKPHQAAVLDLQSKDSLGLLLPVVALIDTLKSNPLSENVPGMFVYNTTIDDAVGLAEGVYFNDGRRWWPAGGGATEPWMVSGSTAKTKASLNTQNIYQMGQVSINTDTLLSITQLNVVANNKGIMIPRLTQAERDSIKLGVDSIANSLMIYNTTEDCYNYYSRTEGSWQSLCGKQGKAVFTMNCDTTQVLGTYGEDVALNSSNFIKVMVNITKIGSYSIQAIDTAAIDNGYFFETSGTFYSTGQFFITVPGTGQPKKHTQGANLVSPADDNPDGFALTSTGSTDTCYFQVNVMNTEVQPVFDINCGSVLVQGAYFQDSVLTSKPNAIYDKMPNQISVQLSNIPTTSFGAIAHLETNTVDGISFSWTGTLESSSQTVIMQGTGTPRGLNDKILTITSNSTSSSGSCSATVSMLIPRKRLMALSSDEIDVLDDTYGYNPCRVTGGRGGFNDLLTDKNNFGYNQWSILKFAGFNNTPNPTGAAIQTNFVPVGSTLDNWTDDGRDMIGIDLIKDWQHMSATTLHNYLYGLNGHRKIDIFMIAYTYITGGNPPAASAGDWFRTGNANDKALCQELVNFTHNGGILMVCSEDPVSNQNFLNLMFGTGTAITATQGHGPGTNYSLGFNSVNTPTSLRANYCLDTDPILTGPFNNILGRSWGEDASTTVYFNNVPLDSIVIYSSGKSIKDPMVTAGIPDESVTIFRHTEYPFVFMGDAGFNSHDGYGTGHQNAALGTACPFLTAPTTKNGQTYPYYPNYRTNFGPTASGGGRVDNTSFTANAFAWCIMQAEAYREAHK